MKAKLRGVQDFYLRTYVAAKTWQSHTYATRLQKSFFLTIS